MDEIRSSICRAFLMSVPSNDNNPRRLTDGVDTECWLICQLWPRPCGMRFFAYAEEKTLVRNRGDKADRSDPQFKIGVNLLDLAHGEHFNGDIVLCDQIDRVLL